MRFLLLAAAVLVSGCATAGVGPVDRADHGALVTAATPGESVLLSGPGTWTPNSRRLGEMANTGDLLSPQAAPWKNGVTIITDRGLSFAEWDARASAYVVIKRIARSEMANTSVTSEGRSCGLVVQEAHDASFHLFEFTRGMMNDCATARTALAALTAQGQP